MIILLQVVLKLDPSGLWSCLFFLMLFTLGIDSQFCGVESLMTGLVDNWPDYLRPRKIKFTFFMVILMLILGIPMITNVCIRPLLFCLHHNLKVDFAHSGRSLHFPTDGLLRCQWHVAVMVRLFPNYRHLLDLWRQEDVRVHWANDWFQDQLVLVHLLDGDRPMFYGGKYHERLTSPFFNRQRHLVSIEKLQINFSIILYLFQLSSLSSFSISPNTNQ